MVGKAFFAWSIVLLAVSAPFAGAEMMQTITISDYFSLSHTADDDISLANLLKNRWDFRSTGNANVKAQFQIDTWLLGLDASTGMPAMLLDIPRAYIRVRFPGFRAEAGKTRVSWGEGFLFNAGDVIFGGMSLPADISAAELRDETDLFASVYIPLGRFSFFETVFLPNPEAAAAGPGFYLPEAIDISDASAGGRIYFEIKPIATAFEIGYLYDGEARTHRPYTSLHGHLLLDWNLSAALSVPHTEIDPAVIAEDLDLSFGLFHMIGLEGDSSLTLRLETALQPAQRWKEEATAVTGPGIIEQPVYGIYLYPEIVYSPDSALSCQLRSVISPVDGSAVVFGGMSWNMYQGFTVGCMLSGMIGDENDHFGWGRDGDLSLTLSVEYIFGE
ncbi:MAG: hypothetical protein JW881_14015 [Spirochaetales bacterium]|nr:hypothetical protein [Spirochaetales bacterium]